MICIVRCEISKYSPLKADLWIMKYFHSFCKHEVLFIFLRLDLVIIFNGESTLSKQVMSNFTKLKSSNDHGELNVYSPQIVTD